MPNFNLFDNENYTDDDATENIIKWLFSDLGMSKHLISASVLKGLMLKKNKDVYRDMRGALQKALNQLHEKQEHHDHVIDDLDHMQVLVGNMLSIYAFAEPFTGETLDVPVKIDGEWEMVKYTIERIQLTSAALSDPYYAYGLVPENDKADSKLLFMGTNPIPTAYGARITRCIDLVPGQSVGEIMYRMGEKELHEWIDENSKEKKVTAYGQSLGGCLSLITHVMHPDKVDAEAYSPAALLPHLSRKYKKNIDEMEGDPSVNIYTQKNDFVFNIGTWLPETSGIYLISPNKNSSTNKLYNHMKAFIATDPVSIEKLDAKDHVNGTAQRWSYALVWQILAVPFFIWNVLYMGLKALAYPVNRLVEKITDDPSNLDAEHHPEQRAWQKIVSILYDVISRIIALPFLVADLALTVALGAVAVVAFSLLAGFFATCEKLGELRDDFKQPVMK